MKYIQLDQLNDSPYGQDIWHLLCKYDQSFIPALSSRQSTSQSNLAETEQDANLNQCPDFYFDNLREQSILLAINEQDKAVGFMSYKTSYTSSDIPDQIETVYITTIIVDEAYRRYGITSTFYRLIEEIGQSLNKPIMTRTWSTNEAHIQLLNKIGLLEIKRIKDARGKNIDTVYFRKHLGGR